jgi:hypothetical protein
MSGRGDQDDPQPKAEGDSRNDPFTPAKLMSDVGVRNLTNVSAGSPRGQGLIPLPRFGRHPRLA